MAFFFLTAEGAEALRKELMAEGRGKRRHGGHGEKSSGDEAAVNTAEYAEKKKTRRTQRRQGGHRGHRGHREGTEDTERRLQGMKLL